MAGSAGTQSWRSLRKALTSGLQGSEEGKEGWRGEVGTFPATSGHLSLPSVSVHLPSIYRSALPRCGSWARPLILRLDGSNTRGHLVHPHLGWYCPRTGPSRAPFKALREGIFQIDLSSVTRALKGNWAGCQEAWASEFPNLSCGDSIISCSPSV